LFSRIAASAPSAFANLINAIHLQNAGVTEIAITGSRSDLLKELQKNWLPTAVVAWGEKYDSPIWSNRPEGFAFVCHDYTCAAPASTIEELKTALRTAFN
jgi:uncharacterized protein YyaL (SSP411 family)